MSCVSIISHNPDQKISSFCESSRAETIELKSRLFKRLGQQRTQKYLQFLTKLMSLKLTKIEFDKLCYTTIGKENIPLHNLLLKSILQTACKSFNLNPKNSNSQKTVTGFSRITRNKIIHQKLHNSTPKRNTDRIIPLGANNKAPHGGFLEVGSVEDGEEVEQVRENTSTSPCVQSKSPIRAPYGINRNIQVSRGNFAILRQFGGQLPDSRELGAKLGEKLGTQGMKLSEDCANLLNLSLDLFLKRLVKTGTELARARNDNLVSINDFRVSFESNRELLGNNGPLWLEKMNDYDLGRE
ncbi:hypothetical protein LUZ60_004953 [Juncus effusus]|nr:hypothetical protein LUZ60_004953 [Juncus effusus]